MLKIEEKLKQYKAKETGLTIYQHNKDMERVLETLRLEKEMHERMKRVIMYHDIGKVVDSFQGDITAKRREVRHELLSASLGCLDEKERLVILTHHKSLEEVALAFFLDEGSYLEGIEEVEKKLEVSFIDIRKQISKYKRGEYKWLLRDKETMLMKGYLLFCDHLASGGKRGRERGESLAYKYNFPTYTSVQEVLKTVQEDVLITAPTGSGKTEASLFWASNKDNIVDRRIVYLLPFLASINAMYERFRKEKTSVGMVHSKAKHYVDEEGVCLNLQYQEFKYYTKQVTITTIHQITKAVMNAKFNEMLLAMFKDALIIVDEVHCYDTKNLAMLLQTLKYLKEEYGARLCVMSASIPKVLKGHIKNELGIEREVTMTNVELEKIKRHTVTYTGKKIETAIKEIQNRIKNGEKVIVCVNTVAQAQNIYAILKETEGLADKDIGLLHSKYTVRDRAKAEEGLASKRLLIGTQTIEVSLDIDYDVMYTEISPIDSQIQRWGRVNRKRVERLQGRKEIKVYEGNSFIYADDIIDRTREVLRSIGEVDEGKVQEYIDTVYIDDLEEYEKYTDKMRDIIADCKVAEWDKAEYQDFLGIAVIPGCLKEEYKSLIDKKEYVEANKLFLQVTVKQYNKAINLGVVEKLGEYGNVIVLGYNYTERVGMEMGLEWKNS